MRIHEAQEAENRAAAEAAGYRVIHNRVGNVYSFDRPGGEEDDTEYPTETAAWSAAWRDLNEQPDDGDEAPAFGPDTPNTTMADELDELFNRLNELDALSLPELELLSEAATRIRELGDEEDI